MNNRVAILAVGTEVTDGQILDRNSALLSQKLTHLGFQVVEHRAVPDDATIIKASLRDLSAACDFLFITGGLGPTSDDFTREVIADFFKLPLHFDEASWTHIQERLGARGIQARDIQKQQCYFPQGAEVIANPAGTANAFTFYAGSLRVFALPGPPIEVEAVWNSHLGRLLENEIPLGEREELFIWRCLGRGESDIAEITEGILRGHNLRVGYRAHVPYVEVKLWVPSTQVGDAVISSLDQALEPWVVGKGKDDAARDLLNRILGHAFHVVDAATLGLLTERIAAAADKSSEFGSIGVVGDLAIESRWDRPRDFTKFAQSITAGDFAKGSEPGLGAVLALFADKDSNIWRVGLIQTASAVLTWHKILPVHNHELFSVRGRHYICEKALLLALQLLEF